MDEVKKLVRKYHEEHGVPPKLLRDLGLTRPQTVEIPVGVRHYLTTTFAESWEDYDALTAEDGWEPRDASNIDSPGVRWKRNEIRGHEIIVHEPSEPRP